MKKILIVDDHQMFAEGIQFLIQVGTNHHVVGVLNTGKSVCSFLNTNHVDLILLDIELPDISGFELAYNIKTQFPDVKILALSMLSDINSINKIIEAGATGYCPKNVGHNELFLAIQKVLTEGFFMPELYYNLLKKQKDSFENTQLSKREEEVIHLIVNGNTTNQIASMLFLSSRTVETHRKNIYKKLGVHTNLELAQFAQKFRLI